MADYTYAQRGVIRKSDGALILPDSLNWPIYLAYRQGGGAVDPMPAPPGPTLD